MSASASSASTSRTCPGQVSPKSARSQYSGSNAAAAFGADTALEGLQRLRRQVDAPQKLSDYGFTAEGVPQAVEIVLEKLPADNPREITAENLTALLTAALHGDDPATVAEPSTAATH